MSMKLLGLCVVMMWVAVAHADPTPTPTTFDVTPADLIWLTSQPAQLEEPIGLRVTSDQPRLGLRAGDLVWAIDGTSPVHARFAPERDGGIVYVEVRRGSQRLELRLVVRPAPRTTRASVATLRELVRRGPRELEQVTKHGKPSGVVVAGFSLVDGIESGDVIRTIDGRPTRSPDDVLAALGAAASHDHMVVDLERLGMPETVTVQIFDPDKRAKELAAMVELVKRIDATHYVIPRQVMQAVFRNPLAMLKGARMVPAIANGKPAGFKLYAIRPHSLFATLGLQNGDTVAQINGTDVTSSSQALDVYVKLRRATKIHVTVRRRGKTLHFTYDIR